MLRDVLKEEGIGDLHLRSEGAIWLKNQAHPTFFRLDPIVAVVQDFIYGPHDTSPSPLEKLLAPPWQEAKWELTPRCEEPSRCEYFGLCHAQTIHDGRLEQAAYTTSVARSLLLSFRDAHLPRQQRTSDIEDVYKLLQPLAEKSFHGNEKAAAAGGHIPVARALDLGSPHDLPRGEEPSEGLPSPASTSTPINQEQGRKEEGEEEGEEGRAGVGGDQVTRWRAAAAWPQIAAAKEAKVVRCREAAIDFPAAPGPGEGAEAFLSVHADPTSGRVAAWGLRLHSSADDAHFSCGSDIDSLAARLDDLFRQFHQVRDFPIFIF